VHVTTIEGRDIAVIALFRPFARPVSTDCRFARLARGVARESVFELAFVGASFGDRVGVITLLEAGDDPIAALGCYARHPGKRAEPAILALTDRTASVVPRSVAVVASLWRVDSRIPANDRHTKEPGDRTSVAVLDPHAVAGAAVIVVRIVVVAGLNRIAHTVTATQGDDAARPAVSTEASASSRSALAALASRTAAAADSSVAAHAG
jgi:hypothetical protein